MPMVARRLLGQERPGVDRIVFFFYRTPVSVAAALAVVFLHQRGSVVRNGVA